MSNTKKIEAFKVAVQSGVFDIDEKFMVFLVDCIKVAGLDIQLQTIPTKTIPTTTITKPIISMKTKKLSGYNVYMIEKMAEIKKDVSITGDRMTAVAKAWKALSEDEKQVYKTQASLTEPVAFTEKAEPGKKGPKSLTGYQFFVKEQMPSIKVNSTIVPMDRLVEIGKLWKKLSTEIHAEYKVKASLFIKPTVSA